MAKWARVENGVVAETIGFNPAGKFHPSIGWTPCADSVAAGDIYDGSFQKPPARPLSEIKNEVQVANKLDCRAHILAKYSDDTQRNAALGIYGEEYAATCADFIARCIAVEDDAFDAVAACTTAEEIAALPAVVFPEV